MKGDPIEPNQKYNRLLVLSFLNSSAPRRLNNRKPETNCKISKEFLQLIHYRTQTQAEKLEELGWKCQSDSIQEGIKKILLAKTSHAKKTFTNV